MSETQPLRERSHSGRQNRCNMAKSLDDIKSSLFWRAVGAELLGTLLLVFFGCGTCITWVPLHPPSMVQIALAFGLIVGTMVWCVAAVSGGHINPAVTIALLITRKISVLRGILFIIVQCLGGIIGAGFLHGVTPEEYRGALGANQLHDAVSPHQGFGVEFLTTFLLVFTVFASVDAKRTDLKGSAPLTIGLAVTVCHLMSIRYTGAGMNPARTFGPAVVTGIWGNHWVYWCGPFLGGIVAGLLYDNIFAMNASLDKTRNYMLSADYDNDDFEPVKKPFNKVNDKEKEDEL